MMAQDDDMMKMSISIYFKCQCRLPPYTPCVSIASCHSARGEEGQEQQIFIKYLSRANFTILPSLLICSRYLLICWYLFVCSFASISANVGDLLVSEDPHYPHHAPNTGTAWIEMFAFLCNCRYFRPILCRVDLIDIFLHNFQILSSARIPHPRCECSYQVSIARLVGRRYNCG